MKILGSKKKGQHVEKNGGKDSVKPEGATEDSNKSTKNWKKKTLKIGAIVLGALILLAASVYAYYWWATETPPAQPGRLRPIPTPVLEENPDNPSTHTSITTTTPQDVRGSRKEGVYTFLVFGIDDMRTDVIMSATFDAKNYTFEVVNIPRDTMVNLNGNMAKINTIVPVMNRQFRGEEDAEIKAMKATKEKYIDILGYEVDYYVSVDLMAFPALVDSVGGVEFYIP